MLDNSIGLSRHIRPGGGANDLDGLEVRLPCFMLDLLCLLRRWRLHSRRLDEPNGLQVRLPCSCVGSMLDLPCFLRC